MQTSITEILSELYLLDPTLKNKEAEIIILLEKMVANKPITEIDETFKNELKRRLFSEAQALNPTFHKAFSWRNIGIGFFAGWAVAAFASYAVISSFLPSMVEVSTSSPEKMISEKAPLAMVNQVVDFSLQKEQKPNAAFGTLSLSNTVSSSPKTWRILSGEKKETSSIASPIAPVDTPAVAPTMVPKPSASVSSDMGAGSAPVSAKRVAAPNATMIAPYPPYEQKVYEYTYSGAAYTYSGSEMEVLQKKKGTLSSSETKSFLQNFGLSNIDLTVFSDLKIGNISFFEEKEYGLWITIDFSEGQMNINRNWSFWPQVACTETECPQTRIEDIPSDESVIQIAQSFLETYKIPTNSYGKPYVQNEWRKIYTASVDQKFAYVPDTVSVIFPLVIDGKTVYEEYGQPKGITINIDVKSQKVSDVTGLEKLDFEASKYEIESNFSKILEVAKNGGRNFGIMPPYIGADDVKTTTIEVPLGEPSLEYVHTYEYTDGKNKEYLVPALVFPVVREPKEGEYFSNKVIVPIVKDFFDRRNTPMPIMYKEMSR